MPTDQPEDQDLTGDWFVLADEITPELVEYLHSHLPSRLPETIAEVSFEAQRRILDQERRYDDSDYREGGFDQGTTLGEFLRGSNPGSTKAESLSRPIAGHLQQQLVDQFGLRPHLDRGIKFLSSGEFRKAIVVRALTTRATILLLVEPFEGLDQASRIQLGLLIGDLLVKTIPRPGLIFLSQAAPPIDLPFPNALLWRNNQAVLRGPIASFHAIAKEPPITPQHIALPTPARGQGAAATPLELVYLEDCTVRYDDRAVLDRVNLTIRAGDHTLVVGPNGSGKSTLINLITGDCPQVYSNKVRIFGRPRGTGESIWEIKKRLGHVSQSFHRSYVACGDTTLLAVLVSGFHDSVGLYRPPSDHELSQARSWLALLGLHPKHQYFSDLSYGQQRLLLIARAAIKQPDLLLLDEACHGLEPGLRREVLDFVDHLGQTLASTIIHVTHDSDEYLSCTKQRLALRPNGLDVDPTWLLEAP